MARILIIDDDMMVARLLDDYLSNEGYEIAKVTMAEEGFDSAMKTPPDLIILDVNLPDATGFQVCGRFRDVETTRNTPIIMVTGAARFPNQQAIGKSLGANEYILKPFNVVEVGEKVRRLLGNKAAAATEKKTEATAKTSTSVTIPADEPAEEKKADTVTDLSLQRLGDIRPTEPAAVEPIAPLKSEPVHQNGHSKEPMEIAREVKSAPWEPLTPRADAPPPKQIPPTESESESQTALGPVTSAPEHDEASPSFPAVIQHTPTAVEDNHSLPPWPLAGCLFMAQMILTVITLWIKPDRGIDPLMGASSVAAGWALLLGLSTASAAALGIKLLPVAAIEVIGIAAIPIVVKTALTLLGTAVPALRALIANPQISQLPAAPFWLHPIDIFETIAVIILGIGLRLRTRTSVLRCIAAAAIVALTWALMSRGYFRPL